MKILLFLLLPLVSCGALPVDEVPIDGYLRYLKDWRRLANPPQPLRIYDADAAKNLTPYKFGEVLLWEVKPIAELKSGDIFVFYYPKTKQREARFVKSVSSSHITTKAGTRVAVGDYLGRVTKVARVIE
jgi:hypothetical protein